MGQGVDRLMSGEMSLWEYQAIVHEWNARQPSADGKIPEYDGPMPTEDEWDDFRATTARTIGNC